MKFVELLHDTVRHVLKDGLDEIWENGAKQLQEGWMHINGESRSYNKSITFLLTYIV